jgi:hypothetical protein
MKRFVKYLLLPAAFVALLTLGLADRADARVVVRYRTYSTPYYAPSGVYSYTIPRPYVGVYRPPVVQVAPPAVIIRPRVYYYW